MAVTCWLRSDNVRSLSKRMPTGIAEAAIDDAITFVREKSRPWIEANVDRASDDPYVIADIGRLKLELHAAEALLRKAARVLDEVNAAPIDAASAARASIAVAEAKVLTTEIALQASEKLFELAGDRDQNDAHPSSARGQ